MQQIHSAFAALKCIYLLITAVGSAQDLQGDGNLSLIDVVWVLAQMNTAA